MSFCFKIRGKTIPTFKMTGTDAYSLNPLTTKSLCLITIKNWGYS